MSTIAVLLSEIKKPINVEAAGLKPKAEHTTKISAVVKTIWKVPPNTKE